MNPFKSELSNIAGIALSGLAMTCCGSILPATSTAFNVVNALAPNFTHQFLSGLDYGRFKDFLIKPHPGDLNHDLDRLMKDALLQAFHHIETAYINKLESETDFSFWQKLKDKPFKEAKEAFKILRKNLLREEDYQKEFSSSISDEEKIEFNLSQWLKDGTWDSLPKISNVLFKFQEIENEEKWQELKKYFEEHLSWIYDLSFKEALKDERNLKAYKAYQMFVLQMLIEQNTQTHQKLDEIKVTLFALENNLLTQNQIELNNHLENDIQKLRKEVNGFFTQIISAIKQSEKTILDKIDEKGNEIIEKITNKQVIERNLTEPPFRPDVFLGREEDLVEMRKILFDENHLLLLVNGDGGVGKTSLASRYYHQYQTHYSYMAWVLKETSIGDALLTLAPKLFIQFDPLHSKKERLEILIIRLSNLNKPCLLVIDNANDYDDLSTYYKLLNRCSNFHILLTTRITEFEQARTKQIGSLPIETALQLFQKYYPEVADEEQVEFKNLYDAVKGNTLVLELIAKQLREANKVLEKYQLHDLISDLQTKGIFRLQHSSKVKVNYQKFEYAKPEDVLAALYDLEELSENERKLCSIMAVLPPEGIQIKTLSRILPQISWWEDALIKLSLKGWLDFNKKEKEVKISPVVQEIIRNKNASNLQTDTSIIINSLSYELVYEGWSEKIHGGNPDFKETSLFAMYAESVLSFCFSEDYETLLLAKRLMRHYGNYLNNDFAKLWFAKIENTLVDQHSKELLFLWAETQKILGNVYKSEGRMKLALDCFQKDFEISKALHESYPEQVLYKNNLGSAYSKLGDVYQSEGRMNLALECFQKDLEISKSLYESYPEQVAYKNGLGIAYQRLGDVYQSEGQMKLALECFQKDFEISKVLHESYPEQVEYKYGLGIAYAKLGDVYKSEGQMKLALECFQKDLEISKALHESYPEQVLYKNNLGIAYSKLGDVYQSEGRTTQALECFQKYLEIEKSLHESYPEQVLYKNNLGIAYSKLGDVYKSEWRMSLALECFQKDLEISKSLYESYPEQVSYKHGLGIAYQRLGDVHQSEGQMKLALECFQKYLEISKSLHESYPEQVEYQFGFGLSLIYLGRITEKMSQNANEYFQKAYLVYQNLLQKVPNHALAQQNLNWLKRKLDK